MPGQQSGRSQQLHFTLDSALGDSRERDQLSQIEPLVRTRVQPGEQPASGLTKQERTGTRGSVCGRRGRTHSANDRTQNEYEVQRTQRKALAGPPLSASLAIEAPLVLPPAQAG